MYFIKRNIVFHGITFFTLLMLLAMDKHVFGEHKVIDSQQCNDTKGDFVQNLTKGNFDMFEWDRTRLDRVSNSVGDLIFTNVTNGTTIRVGIRENDDKSNTTSVFTIRYEPLISYAVMSNDYINKLQKFVKEHPKFGVFMHPSKDNSETMVTVYYSKEINNASQNSLIHVDAKTITKQFDFGSVKPDGLFSTRIHDPHTYVFQAGNGSAITRLTLDDTKFANDSSTVYLCQIKDQKQALNVSKSACANDETINWKINLGHTYEDVMLLFTDSAFHSLPMKAFLEKQLNNSMTIYYNTTLYKDIVKCYQDVPKTTEQPAGFNTVSSTTGSSKAALIICLVILFIIIIICIIVLVVCFCGGNKNEDGEKPKESQSKN